MAVKNNQDIVEAICVSSYSPEEKEVNARYVNLKIVEDTDFIFFSNYNSPKAQEFKNHDQVAISIHWSSIAVQIRMKGKIKKSKNELSDNYFKNRKKEKNALAISSYQSKYTESYDVFLKKYNKVLLEENLFNRPKYWGGFNFTPYYFEFWQGHDSRINKRETYELQGDCWKNFYLEP